MTHTGQDAAFKRSQDEFAPELGTFGHVGGCRWRELLAALESRPICRCHEGRQSQAILFACLFLAIDTDSRITSAL